jgi:hypothetical protein
MSTCMLVRVWKILFFMEKVKRKSMGKGVYSLVVRLIHPFYILHKEKFISYSC